MKKPIQGLESNKNYYKRFKKMTKEIKNNFPGEFNDTQDTTVFLETELVLQDSMSADIVMAHKLKKRDLVLAKIVDQRDIAQYLAHLLGGKKEEKVVPLAIAVDRIEVDEKKVKVYTIFSPRVVGISILSIEDKVKIVKKERTGLFEKILGFFFRKKGD
ncbi:hypothetical protein KAU39_03050 [bacterium]|nr:hypothetical protein [bacterium]